MARPTYQDQAASFWSEDPNPGWIEAWDDWCYEKETLHAADFAARAADARAADAAAKAAALAAKAAALAAAQAERKAQQLVKDRAERERQHAAAWRDSGVPGRYNLCTFDNFKAETEQQREALSICERFPYFFDEDEEYDHDRVARNLWLLGPVGVGKSHLACAVLRNMHASGSTVIFTTTLDLIRDLHGPHGGRYTDCDVLVLDDIGASSGSNSELIKLFDVINARDAHDLHTVITSNLDPAELSELLGDRIYSRLRHKAVFAPIDGEDHRQGVKLHFLTRPKVSA